MGNQNVLRSAAAHALVPIRTRRWLLNAMGANLGPGVSIGPGVLIKASPFAAGDGCFINHGCFIDRGAVTLGRNVFLGPGVKLIANNHEMGSAEKRAGRNVAGAIVIGDGSWLGANVVVLPNVTIAPGCVVGANSLVVRDTEPNGVYVGSPARRIRDLDDQE